VPQQATKLARIGTPSLSAGPHPNTDVFQALREMGWVAPEAGDHQHSHRAA